VLYIKELWEGLVMSLSCLLLILPLLCGCIDFVGDSGNVSVADTTTSTDQTAKGCCSGLTIKLCMVRTDCTTIFGWVPTQGKEGICVDFRNQPLVFGCRSIAQECGEAITVAAPAHQPDRCIWFSNTCIPSGWRECNVGDVPECPSP
jgi:hypothetical protein